MASISSWRHFVANSSSSPVGLSSLFIVEPRSSVYTVFFIVNRSTTPRKSASAPIGTWIGTAGAPRRSRIFADAVEEVGAHAVHLVDEDDARDFVLIGLAPDGSDCGCTAATESNNATSPSSTRSERSTSTVKSTWPGVSIILMRVSRHVQAVAADVIVMPRSCSWTIQSIVAAPSCTSPILCVRPV